MEIIGANKRWPTTCSCGIVYIDHTFDNDSNNDKILYRQHLKDYHIVDFNELINT